ncbi:tyrosine-type recombinase/integrase [Oxalobacter formigenes]|uniref:tyrosine-type recombinase/integrase n=1 Tax=Oxalobacter formigenes TaxID=847 RepID=UPI000A29F204|nr:site-specific integrase [Oxalobacter formigenes]ARQ46069.1 Tyrosine recombinase XerD [Oxalobacter formigenes]MCZ4063698.1 site-specific integrase [Oxalobacter formigenes]QDX33194.1 site-specific integrase [Oxalobacter formigenes]
MASFRKKGNGWVAEIARAGFRQSKSFVTKAEAVAWATQTEADLLAGKRGRAPNKPLNWLLEKYSNEVSTTKKGVRWEQIRLSAMSRDEIGKIMLSDLHKRDITEWRDRRLRTVSSATVNREWNLLSNVFTIAMNEWGFLDDNPMKTVRRPVTSKARDRRISEDEIERMLLACGYDYETPPETTQARVGAAFLFAIETAMRAGEIVSLTSDDIDIDKRTARLKNTKNGTDRDVPLSSEAIRILKQLPEENTCFDIASSSLDALFRKAKKRAMIDDLHFHDTRHESITRLAKKLDVLSLARMVGHRDLKMLMVYYNETAEELAKKLD